jgi:hypothetical protein
VLAADSATPRAGGYGAGVIEVDGRHSPFRAWGVYVAGSAVHVWTRAEYAGLHVEGVEAAWPIVVPPQSWPWIMPEDVVAVDLVREAEAWGVPHGAPLALDIEEKWAERMGSQLGNVIALFSGAARAARFTPVIYGSERTLASAGMAGRWLAAWLREPGSAAPPTPKLEAPLFAWQYAGNVAAPAGEIDLNVLAVPAVLMSTDFSVPSGLVTISEEGQVTPVLGLTKHPTAAEEAKPVEAPSTTPADKSAGPVGAPTDYVRLFLGGGDQFVGDEFVDVATVGTGYYALTRLGHVEAVRLPHHGEPGVDGCVAIAATPSGAGYFVLTEDGRIFHYGDAGTTAAADVRGAPADA